MGIGTGIAAFLMEILEEFLIHYKWKATQYFLNHDMFWGAMMMFLLLSVLLGAVAGGMTVYWGPGAAGSGLAETMAYINGVNYPGFIGVSTLITKILGVIFAVAATLKIGKEGPLAHIGSIIGVGMIYMPWSFSRNFRNDSNKRLLVASGAGVGVAVAFGAPIGGTLFAFEVAKSTPFFNFSLAWKTFLATALACFTINLLVALKEGTTLDIVNGGLIKFGHLENVNFKLSNLPEFIIIGCVSGVIGSLFIWGNVKVTKWRKRNLTSKNRKFAEVLALTFIIALITFILPLATNVCTENSDDPDQIKEDVPGLRYLCPENSYNTLASLLFNTEGETLRYFFSHDAEIKAWVSFIFFLYWFIFTLISYGTAVPAGLFFPGMLIGCSIAHTIS